MAHTIIANFWQDYIDTLKQHLLSKGFIASGNEQDKDVFIAHFNWLHRRIAPKPRTVHVPINFQAPAQFTSEVATIRKDIEAGTDITPRLSRRIADWAYTDSMLSDWGIYHLHLGSSLDPDGFRARTGPLLFVRLDDANAYFLGVFDHKSWTNPDLIEIVHVNWPKTIERYKLDVTQLNWEPTSDERKKLRAVGINASVRLKDGTVYQPIGGGMASDGTPVDIALRLANTRRSYRQGQKVAETELLKQVGLSMPDQSLTMRLELDLTNAFAVEDSTGFRLKLW
ncbi:MAG: hypothetical protein ACJ8R9_17250 [Steroidobacteraceae bacterium]